MIKSKLILTTLIIAFLYLSQVTFSQCPITSYQPDIYINSLLITNQNLYSSVNNQSNIIIIPNTQVKTYSHLLTKPFTKQPNIATTISDFAAQYSLNLFLSIKPYFVGDGIKRLNTLNFAIRTQWKYIQWKKIKFGFIAEERTDIQVGIYQIQTGILDSYQQNKQLQLFFPYHSIFANSPTVITFLTGFEISSKQINNYYSPLQIQQRLLSKNNTGFSVSFSVTSNTLVSQLVISYIAYDSRLLSKVFGSTLVYENYSPQQIITKNIATSLPGQMRDFLFGVNGFIMTSKQNLDISLQTTFTPGTKDFTWASTNSILYFAFSQFALLGNKCTLCEGYPYFYINSCVTTCPVGTFLLSDTCVSCPSGTNWNGTLCITVCSGGRTWNNTSQTCQCQLNTFWNGSSCGTCPSGQYLNTQLNQCLCISGNWNGKNCVQCQANQIWNTYSLSCECQSGSSWNGTLCLICTGGKVWDYKNLICSCQAGTNFNGTQCVYCTGDTSWNDLTLSCQCNEGTIWNGTLCIQSCLSNQMWNSYTLKCQCQQSLYWNGVNCTTCSVYQFFNTSTLKCQCQTGYYDAGNNNCLLVTYCSGGRIFNTGTKNCECPSTTVWNGTKCNYCTNNSFWSQSLKLCICPQTNKYYDSASSSCLCNSGYKLQTNGSCTIKCSDNQVFNGTQCVLTCSLGAYYNGTNCVTYTPQCPNGTQWSVYQCVTIQNACPYGMKWTGKCCISQQTKCLENNNYWNGSTCIALSDRCPYQLQWKNNMCLPIAKNCPTGSYFNGYFCISYQTCQANMIWSPTLVKCICDQGAFWNGMQCIKCDNGLIYTADGCTCPTGMVFNGTICSLSNQNYCKTVSHANWNGTNCVCFPGYSAINGNCVCYGLQLTNWCNRCYQKLNSFYQNGICTCLDGYIQSNNQCIKPEQLPQTSNSANQTSCSVSTFWDSQRKLCLPCSDGCLSCISCYKCNQCKIGFVYNPTSQLCEQICGDGKRFKLQCDDGNNIPGDGCSLDCKVQSGFTCSGGSPNSKDVCIQYIPTQISFVQTGQSHLFGKIVLNVRANYLPLNLTSVLNGCKQSCINLLTTKISQTSQYPSSISVQYIGGAYNSISIELDFKKQPIQRFTIDINLNSQLKQKYLPSINLGTGLKINIQPLYLAIIVQKDYLH